MSKDNLGDRMKTYERVPRLYLTRRTPVIIRLDGKSFHTFTKGLDKPFDNILTIAMTEATKYLCKNIQGCKIGYTQSDEISLLLTDYDSLDTSAWFDNNVQKMVSVSASMATLAFNKAFKELAEIHIKELGEYTGQGEEEDTQNKMGELYSRALLLRRKYDIALFDSRVFSLPKEEVVNYFIFRQQDAIRNSKQAVGQSYFSHKELHKKSTKEIVEALRKEKGLDWNKLDKGLKWGRCVIRNKVEIKGATRHHWLEDVETPEFTIDRGYIEKYL